MSTGRGFEADLDRLDSGATTFSGFAEAAGRIASDLRQALDEHGACWGTDAVGTSFAESHVRHASDALDRVGGLPGRLGGVGTRFGQAAAGYRGVDSGEAAQLRATAIPSTES
ncbi:WXG100 family type VII secretion target [Umezawaea beigongshangensis]|uniref:WXG100 family type VII secretion target n=1 Tax=Umezawaea beigongshangensis TaxID=2780383 RepID=UPI0018F1E44E|nr:hypothetical protein [Umezawaea beigongshangensis]